MFLFHRTIINDTYYIRLDLGRYIHDPCITIHLKHLPTRADLRIQYENFRSIMGHVWVFWTITLAHPEVDSAANLNANHWERVENCERGGNRKLPCILRQLQHFEVVQIGGVPALRYCDVAGGDLRDGLPGNP